jgi:hypothetical protein
MGCPYLIGPAVCILAVGRALLLAESPRRASAEPGTAALVAGRENILPNSLTSENLRLTSLVDGGEPLVRAVSHETSVWQFE